MKRFATERLLKEIDRMKKGPEGLDGDYFVDAQDFDHALGEEHFGFGREDRTATRAMRDVLLNGAKGMRKKLIVHLVKESGSWKVDKVQGRDGD